MLIPLLFSLITLSATCWIEYITLTMRGRPVTHIIVRSIAYSLGVALYLLFNHLGIRHYSVYYSISGIYLAACIFLFDESLSQIIFLFFTEWCFTTFISALCNWATAWIASENLRFAIRIGLYISSFIILIPLYHRHGRTYVQEMLYLFNKSKPVYAAFPVLALILFTILFGPLTTAGTLFQFITMALFICFIFFTYYLMISHFHMVFASLQVENRLIGTKRQLVLQKKYYEEVNRGVRMQEERLHDTRHHLVALSAMASTKQNEAISGYIADLLDQYGRSPTRRYCENEVANAVLGGYIGLAESKGIKVSVELDVPQEIGMDEYELCTLFGNTLENAIEACQRIPRESALYAGRYIRLKSRVERGRLSIRMENSYHDDPSVKKGNFNSSKGARGGIGLESVKAVLDLYQGCLNCERQDNTFIFSAVLNLES